MSVDTHKLEAAAKRLNAQRERVSKAIVAADKRIVDISPGVSVWLEEPVEGYLIGFHKLESKWHLAARPVGVKGKAPGDVIQLAYAPLKVRLASLTRIDEIVEAITENVEQKAVEIAAQVKAAGIEPENVVERRHR